MSCRSVMSGLGRYGQSKIITIRYKPTILPSCNDMQRDFRIRFDVVDLMQLNAY